MDGGQKSRVLAAVRKSLSAKISETTAHPPGNPWMGRHPVLDKGEKNGADRESSW